MSDQNFDLREYIDSIPHDKLKEMAIEQEKQFQEYRVKLFEVKKAFAIVAQKQYESKIASGLSVAETPQTFDEQVEQLQQLQKELKLKISEVNGKLFSLSNTQQIIKLNGGARFVERLKERAIADKVQADVVEKNIKELYTEIFQAKIQLQNLQEAGLLEEQVVLMAK